MHYVCPAYYHITEKFADILTERDCDIDFIWNALIQFIRKISMQMQLPCNLVNMVYIYYKILLSLDTIVTVFYL